MWTLAVCVIACALQVSAATITEESDSQYWLKNGKRMVEARTKTQLRTNMAKNLIMFLGDGMSVTTLTAARIYKGQLQNTSGESDHLSFEQFPFTGISKTYCVNYQVPDSACTATAYLSGVKTNKGTIGVTANVQRSDCPSSVPEDRHPTSLMQWAQWSGKATGIVTTTRVTHASPAGAYAHVADRDWESDADMKAFEKKTNITLCEDIAKQLVTRNPGRNLKVIMGGGRDWFTMKGENSTGMRSDENLIQKWKNDKQVRFGGKNAKYVTNKEELLNTNMADVDFVLGLFHRDHMNYRLKSDPQIQPTLQDMTKKAIELLQKEPNGYVLFVEGGLIDHAHHSTLARMALDETVEFSKAIAEAAAMTSEDDTLIVVTSDHAHTLSMSGYPKRGEDILGSPHKLAMDNMTYTTLSYANGPKASFGIQNGTCLRNNVTKDDLSNVDYQYPSLVPLDSETHGGDDVMVFARGPWAHFFTGNFEQNEIPIAMAMAAGISMDPPKNPSPDHTNSGSDARLSFIGQAVMALSLLLSLVFRSAL